MVINPPLSWRWKFSKRWKSNYQFARRSRARRFEKISHTEQNGIQFATTISLPFTIYNPFFNSRHLTRHVSNKHKSRLFEKIPVYQNSNRKKNWKTHTVFDNFSGFFLEENGKQSISTQSSVRFLLEAVHFSMYTQIYIWLFGRVSRRAGRWQSAWWKRRSRQSADIGCQRANLVSRSGEYSVTQALDVSDRSITPR